MSDYPVYQISLGAKYGMATVRSEGWDEFVEAVEIASGGKSQAVIDFIAQGFAELVGGTIKTSTGFNPAPNETPSTIRWRPAKTAEEELHEQLGAAPECPGHHVPMVLKDGRRGKFWSCNGLGPDGKPAWTSQTACPGQNFVG